LGVGAHVEAAHSAAAYDADAEGFWGGCGHAGILAEVGI
jgi:hypothetical protein